MSKVAEKLKEQIGVKHAVLKQKYKTVDNEGKRTRVKASSVGVWVPDFDAKKIVETVAKEEKLSVPSDAIIDDKVVDGIAKAVKVGLDRKAPGEKKTYMIIDIAVDVIVDIIKALISKKMSKKED